MALTGTPRSIKRQSDFKGYLSEIQDVLAHYIKETDDKGKSGWQNQAAQFSQAIEQLGDDPSLFLLRDKTLGFCESLRSFYNYYSSSIFSDSFIKSLGSYVGVGRGSGLRESLMPIVQKINPLKAGYISEEIFFISIYDRPFTIAKLSPESIQALIEIASDSSKEIGFLEESHKYNWIISPKELLEMVREQDNNKTRSSKVSSGYFF